MNDVVFRPSTSASIAALAAALAKAQGQFTNPQKDRNNPFFKSKYATLDAMIDSTRAILAENELSVVQVIRTDHGLELCTRLMHSSGEWIESTVPLSMAKEGPQKLGSEITYMRRYCYGAILSITADEDDDGNSAQSEPKKAVGNRQEQAPQRGPIDPPPGQTPHKKTVKEWLDALQKDFDEATGAEAVDAILARDEVQRAQDKLKIGARTQLDDMIRDAIARTSPKPTATTADDTFPGDIDYLDEDAAETALRP